MTVRGLVGLVAAGVGAGLPLHVLWLATPLSGGVAGAVLAVLAAVGIALHVSIRCPACDYPLGYHRPLGVPRRGERCGARLT